MATTPKGKGTGRTATPVKGVDQDGAKLIPGDELGFNTTYVNAKTGRSGNLREPEGQPSTSQLGRLNRLGMLAIVEPRPEYFLTKGVVSWAMDEAERSGLKPIPSTSREDGDSNGNSARPKPGRWS